MKTFKCRFHGELNEITGFRQAAKREESGWRLRCKKCADDKKQKTIEKNIASGFKMPEVLEGVCRKHGNLNSETGFICFDKTLPKGYRIRCKECTYNLRANNYLKNPELKIKQASEWKKANRARINEQVKLDRQANPEKYKRWSSDHYDRNRYELSLKMSLKERNLERDFYEKLLKEQDNKCAICNLEETRMARDGKNKTRLCIDHDHETQKVRQLLCHDCNTAIGKLKDSPELALKAADYLILHKGWTE